MTFLHTELLDSLKERVKGRSEQHRARMAKGLSESEYREMVGRDKECLDLINAITEVANENEDDDEHDSKKPGRAGDGPG